MRDQQNAGATGLTRRAFLAGIAAAGAATAAGSCSGSSNRTAATTATTAAPRPATASRRPAMFGSPSWYAVATPGLVMRDLVNGHDGEPFDNYGRALLDHADRVGSSFYDGRRTFVVNPETNDDDPPTTTCTWRPPVDINANRGIDLAVESAAFGNPEVPGGVTQAIAAIQGIRGGVADYGIAVALDGTDYGKIRTFRTNADDQPSGADYGHKGMVDPTKPHQLRLVITSTDHGWTETVYHRTDPSQRWQVGGTRTIKGDPKLVTRDHPLKAGFARGDTWAIEARNPYTHKLLARLDPDHPAGWTTPAQGLLVPKGTPAGFTITPSMFYRAATPAVQVPADQDLTIAVHLTPRPAWKIAAGDVLTGRAGWAAADLTKVGYGHAVLISDGNPQTIAAVTNLNLDLGRDHTLLASLNRASKTLDVFIDDRHAGSASAASLGAVSIDAPLEVGSTGTTTWLIHQGGLYSSASGQDTAAAFRHHCAA